MNFILVDVEEIKADSCSIARCLKTPKTAFFSCNLWDFADELSCVLRGYTILHLATILSSSEESSAQPAIITIVSHLFRSQFGKFSPCPKSKMFVDRNNDVYKSLVFEPSNYFLLRMFVCKGR